MEKKSKGIYEIKQKHFVFGLFHACFVFIVYIQASHMYFISADNLIRIYLQFFFFGEHVFKS